MNRDVAAVGASTQEMHTKVPATGDRHHLTDAIPL